MKQKDLAVVIILSLFTFGIYYLYWLYDASSDLRKKGANSPSIIFLLLPVLGILGSFLLFALVNVATGGNSYAVLNILVFIIGFVSVLAIFPITLWWGYRFAESLEQVSNGAIEKSTNFVIFIVTLLFGLSVVWLAITQSEINKVVKQGISQNNPDSAWG